MLHRISALIALAGVAGGALAGTGPDLTIGGIFAANSFGVVDGVRSFSFGTTLCNLGDAPVGYDASGPNHPVVIQNVYRSVDGRFEQVGMGWAFNTLIALQTAACGPCTPAPGFGDLGAGCSDPHGSGVLGSQALLSRRTEVDPVTGLVVVPQAGIGDPGDAIFKRVQVRESDLQVSGARFYIEVQCVSGDDAAAGNRGNNVSWREAEVTPSGLRIIGATQGGEPAVFAWADETGAMVSSIELGDGSLLHVASLATDNGDGTWSYEYVVHNQDSRRMASGFAVPFGGSTLTEVGFSDVDYHSGEPVDGTDWEGSEVGATFGWSVADASAADANTIRWGTAYSFRFVSDTAPVEDDVAVSLSDANGGIIVSDARAVRPNYACAADRAEPFGVVNFFDIAQYVNEYVAGEPIADIAAPFGELNFFDVAAYIAEFNAGCP